MKLNEKKLYGLSIDELLQTYLNFKDKTLIFFDTETLGLDPTSKPIQLTEIAAVAYDWENANKLGEFRQKVKLRKDAQSLAKQQDSEEEKQGSMKLRAIMRMTRYGVEKEKYKKFGNEESVLKNFAEWLTKFDNPLLIAQNARFDMKFISQRGFFYKLTLPRYKVLDTLQIFKLFFIPAIQTLSDNGDIQADNMLKKMTYKGRVSASLKSMALQFSVDIDKWHSAIADVESLMEVMKKVVEYLKTHSNLDIDKYHRKAIVANRKHSHY